jgi:hypothetical protein
MAVFLGAPLFIGFLLPRPAMQSLMACFPRVFGDTTTFSPSATSWVTAHRPLRAVVCNSQVRRVK